VSRSTAAALMPPSSLAPGRAPGPIYGPAREGSTGVCAGLRPIAPIGSGAAGGYSTVTLFARLRGWSTSVPFSTATW